MNKDPMCTTTPLYVISLSGHRPYFDWLLIAYTYIYIYMCDCLHNSSYEWDIRLVATPSVRSMLIESERSSRQKKKKQHRRLLRNHQVY